MITPAHAQLMARYNRWQNQSLYKAADQITDADRKGDQGAFFGSIHATLNHLLWGDQVWLHRFAGTPPPQAKSPKESVQNVLPWADLKHERQIERGGDLRISDAALAQRSLHQIDQ